MNLDFVSSLFYWTKFIFNWIHYWEPFSVPTSEKIKDKKSNPLKSFCTVYEQVHLAENQEWRSFKKYFYNNNYNVDFVQYLLKDVGDDDTYYPY